MILGINTAQKTHEIVLIEDGKILLEKIWQDSKDDVEKLVPTLESMLSELGLSKDEITEILVVTGPGSFTSLRTGVAFANALAAGLNAKLYTLNTFEALKRKAAITDDLLVILNAGGLDVGVYSKGQIQIGELAFILKDFEHEKYNIVSECTETQEDELNSICLEKNWKKIPSHEMQTLGESILTFGLEGLEPQKTVEPFYLKKPHITESSDPWKKP